MAQKLTMRTLETIIENAGLTDFVSYGMKKGKLMVSFVVRPTEKIDGKEEIEYDVSNYTKTEFNGLLTKYYDYFTFGRVVSTPQVKKVPETEKKEETSEESKVMNQLESICQVILPKHEEETQEKTTETSKGEEIPSGEEEKPEEVLPPMPTKSRRKTAGEK